MKKASAENEEMNLTINLNIQELKRRKSIPVLLKRIDALDCSSFCRKGIAAIKINRAKLVHSASHFPSIMII